MAASSVRCPKDLRKHGRMPTYSRQHAITVPPIAAQGKELAWFPYSRTQVKFALGLGLGRARGCADPAPL